MADRLPVMRTFGTPSSPEKQKIMGDAVQDIVARLNALEDQDDVPDVITSVFLTVCLNQIDPVAVFSALMSSMGVAIIRSVYEQQVGHG